MQEVLTRLLDAEKEGEKIISDARSRAAAGVSETESQCVARLREEKEKLHKRMEQELAELTASEEKIFLQELALLEQKKSQLNTDAGSNKTIILEKLKSILCESEIG